MKNTFIYGLIDPRNNQLRYIGKSNRPARRFSQHLANACKKDSKKNNWLTKLKNLKLKPELIILDEIIEKDWGFWEQWWICQCKAWGFDLVNGNEGGEMSSEEIALRRLNSHKKRRGTVVPNEIKKKISDTVRAQSPKKWTKELRQKASESALKKFADGYKPKGAILWKEKELQHPQFKPLAKYNLQGELVGEFYTVEDLVYDYGYRTAFTGCCKYHDIKKGHFYRYINPTETDLPNTIESVKESIDLYLKRKANRSSWMKEVQKQRWNEHSKQNT